MMKYLVILLSNQSTSYCCYDSSKNIVENELIPLDTLQNAIRYAFIEDLFIQFVLPSWSLPQEYENIIFSIKASIIAPVETRYYKVDVLVINGFVELKNSVIRKDVSYVLRINKSDFFDNYKSLVERLSEFSRLNIIFTDIENFTNNDFDIYKGILNELVFCVKDIIISGYTIQLNILTDRLSQEKMNNCNAGNNTITLASNGQFYICPAFYYANEPALGNLKNGLIIKNSQLYQLENAPLCRACDAYQCKRCVFLNKQLTREVNIPSKEQCVMAHLERNASRLLLQTLREQIVYMPKTEIKEISYLDPFDNIKNK